jgi:putative DeoR family transcriptional regulator (stage III sporulation protein D)
VLPHHKVAGATYEKGEELEMRDYNVERVLSAAEYTLDNHSTVRETAKALKVSKTTVHEDLTERLPKIDPQRASKVRGVLMANKAERHIRGGEATRLLYRRLKDAESKKM